MRLILFGKVLFIDEISEINRVQGYPNDTPSSLNSLILVYPIGNSSIGNHRIYHNCQGNLIGKSTSANKI